MKIAICLSGQPRTWRECYESWLLLIDEMKKSPKFGEDLEVDFFIHMWNFNSIPLSTINEYKEKGTPINVNKDYFIVDESEIDEIISKINPKKFLIQDYDVNKSRERVIDKKVWEKSDNRMVKGVISWAGSQLYSIMRSGFLKRQYEVENNFEYDLCIRMRFDVNLDSFNRWIVIHDFMPIQKRTIYACHCHCLNVFPYDAIGDIFFYSDSHTFDIITSFYSWLPNIPFDLLPPFVKIESVFAYYIRVFNIQNVGSKIDPEIKRLDYNL